MSVRRPKRTTNSLRGRALISTDQPSEAAKKGAAIQPQFTHAGLGNWLGFRQLNAVLILTTVEIVCNAVLPASMTTVIQTFTKNLRGRQLYPFAIGFSTVFLLSAYLFRLKECIAPKHELARADEDYLSTNNKRFAKPFIKGADDHGSSH